MHALFILAFDRAPSGDRPVLVRPHFLRQILTSSPGYFWPHSPLAPRGPASKCGYTQTTRWALECASVIIANNIIIMEVDLWPPGSESVGRRRGRLDPPNTKTIINNPHSSLLCIHSSSTLTARPYISIVRG